jgi:hypothetical protein
MTSTTKPIVDAITVDEFAWLTTDQTWFPPTNFVLMYTPSRVSIEEGSILRVPPDYAKHEGQDGVWYTIQITKIYPTKIQPESRIGDIVTREAGPYPHQYAACEILACEASEHFLSHGHRTWF